MELVVKTDFDCQALALSIRFRVPKLHAKAW